MCLEFAFKSDAGNFWVRANRQSGGKGSRGRSWISEPGNLYCSLLLKDAGRVESLHGLTFVASLAIRDAIYHLPGSGLKSVELKWPNDVLISGKKTSGILLEAHRVNDAQYVIIGMGMNIAHYPSETLYPATSLNEEGLETTAQDFFEILRYTLSKRLDQWREGEGFSSIRNDWMLAAANLGKMIEIKLPKQDIGDIRTGIFKGIDEQGLLLLEGASGKLERISVADIFFA